MIGGLFVKYVSVLLCSIAITTSATAYGQEMNNSSVLSLSKAGLSDDLVIAKINTQPCGYDVSINSIIALRNSGLADKIISAMVLRCANSTKQNGKVGDENSSDPKIKRTPGIYVMESWRTPNVIQPIKATRSGGMKTSGNGSIVFPLIAKLVVPGIQSRLPIQTSRPTFYFYFNTSDQKVSQFGSEASEGTESPEEFSLIKMKAKKDTRELEMGRASAYGGALVAFRKGLSLKNAIKFDTQTEGDGIFRVVPSAPLEAGEYAFVFTGGEGSRIYDFSIYPAGATAAPK